jgi:hypothetical protein
MLTRLQNQLCMQEGSAMQAACSWPGAPTTTQDSAMPAVGSSSWLHLVAGSVHEWAHKAAIEH